MGRWDPTYSDAQRHAISQAINQERLSAPEVVTRATAGELAGLPRFDLPESTARDIAAKERRSAAPQSKGEEARDHIRALAENSMDTIERQMASIKKHQREGNGQLPLDG